MAEVFLAKGEASSPGGRVDRNVEIWFRRVLYVFSAAAAFGVLSHFALIFWSHHQFTDPESIVAMQSRILAHDGTLYYSLTTYPYTVCAYMPLFYSLQAAFVKVGLQAVMAGRLISFAATIGIFALVWRLLILYTGDRYCAWIGTLLATSTALFLTWGSVGQVDTLAVFWAIAAFYEFSRYSVKNENTLLLAGGFACLAFFTKQTMLACPAAIFLLLCLRSPKTALRFAAGMAAVALAAVLILNTATHGRFLFNTVRANLFPFAMEKLEVHLNYLVVAAGQLILVAIVGFKQVRKAHLAGPFLYLGIASLVLLGTAPKVGSDANYQIETTVMLVVCSCLALHALDFFSLSFRSRSWVTLLQIPIAVHMILNLRITNHVLQQRIANERVFRAQVAALRPYVSDGGRLLSTDFNSVSRLRDHADVEPLVYKILVRAGVVNPEPLRRDIMGEAFSTIFLYEDINSRKGELDIELSSLPNSQLEEVRRHYRLVAHISGPYLNGVYVYKPTGVDPPHRDR